MDDFNSKIKAMTDEKINKRKKEREDEEKRLKILFNLVFNNDNGIMILKYFLNNVSMYKSTTVLDSQTRELSTTAMIHNEAIRSFYINKIRKYLSNDLLCKVEIEGE